MTEIYGAVSGAAQAPPRIAGVRETPQTQRPEALAAPGRAARDAYIPEEKQEPSGRYWLGRDEDGSPKICFDGPVQPEDVPEAPEDSAPEEGAGAPKEQGGEAEMCTCDTDRVDREIEALKKEQEALESQLRSETDETKTEALRRKLAQVENELRQKDNDAYRRQHADFGPHS